MSSNFCFWARQNSKEGIFPSAWNRDKTPIFQKAFQLLDISQQRTFLPKKREINEWAEQLPQLLSERDSRVMTENQGRAQWTPVDFLNWGNTAVRMETPKHLGIYGQSEYQRKLNRERISEGPSWVWISRCIQGNAINPSKDQRDSPKNIIYNIH
jgi:hypothetical protein